MTVTTDNLGRIVPIHQGDYNPGQKYYSLDEVLFELSSYRVKFGANPPVGTPPTNPAYWDLTASFAQFVSQIEGINPTQLQQIVEALPIIRAAEETVRGIGYFGSIAVTDETTPINLGARISFRMPYVYYLSEVRASLNEPQASGSILTVNVEKNTNSGWQTIFSTPLTFANGAKTTVGNPTPAVISVPMLGDDEEIRVTATQVGDGTAKGLKVLFKGHTPT